MARKVKENWLIKYPGYAKLIWISFRHPVRYASSVAGLKGLLPAAYFGLVNLSLGFFLQIVSRVIIYKDWTLFFPLISEAFLVVFLMFLCLWLLGIVSFIIAKALNGRGNLKNTLASTAYATSPLLLAFLPYIYLPALIFFTVQLIIISYKLHQFSKTKAVVNIIIPLMALILLLISLGLINLNYSMDFSIR